MTKLPAAAAVAAALLAAGCGQSERPAPKLPAPLSDQQLIDRASEGVVAIRATTSVGEAAGTGWVVSPREIITAAHVVDSAEELTVRFKDGRTASAEIAGESLCDDRALLRLTEDVPNMTVLPMAGPEPLGRNARLDLIHYGTNAVADFGHEELTTSPLTVANPRIHEPDLGTGFPALTDLIQLQGVIPQGASGGAVLDAYGRVRGIAVITETERSQGYALPVGQIRDALAGLREGEGHDSLGLNVSPIANIDLAEHFRTNAQFSDVYPETAAETVMGWARDQDLEGLYINAVATGGPSKYKLFPGDMITAVNGAPVHSVADLCGALEDAEPGSELAIDGRNIDSLSSDDVWETWSATVTLG